MAIKTAFFAIFSLVMTVLSGCTQSSEPEPIRIGQLVGDDGEMPQAAQHAQQGVQLLAKQWRAEDQRIAGRPLTVLHVKASGDAQAVRAEAIRLLAVNRVAALLGGFDPAGNEQLLRAARSYNVPVLVPGEMAEAVSQEGVLVLGAPPQKRGRLLAEEARQSKSKRAAVVTDPGSPVAVALATAFVQTWREKEGYTAEEWPYRQETSPTDLASRFTTMKPDIVLLAVPAVRFRTLRARLVSGGVTVPLLYGGEDAGWAVLQTELEPGPAVTLATAYPPTPSTDLGKDFARRYQEAFHEPADLFAAQSYDAARLLVHALSHAQASQGTGLAGQLQQTELFETLTGKVTWHDHQPRRTLFLVRIEGAKRELIRTCPPESP